MGNLIDTDGLDQYTDEITTFTSGDSSSPSSFTNIAVVASKEKPSSLFQKLSQAISNIRYLQKRIVWSIISSVNATISANSTKQLSNGNGGNYVVNAFLYRVHMNNSSGTIINSNSTDFNKVTLLYNQMYIGGSYGMGFTVSIKNDNSYSVYVESIVYIYTSAS